MAARQGNGSTEPQVLIVGAGPVGLGLGIDLARRGVAIRIIDTLAEPTDESRAIVVHSRTLDHFAPLGVLDKIMAKAIISSGMEVHSDGRTPAPERNTHITPLWAAVGRRRSPAEASRSVGQRAFSSSFSITQHDAIRPTQQPTGTRSADLDAVAPGARVLGRQRPSCVGHLTWLARSMRHESASGRVGARVLMPVAMDVQPRAAALATIAAWTLTG
jgi:hypothetical protein